MHRSPSAASSSPDTLEAQGREDLAGGRWRRARDAFKELCKRDRATFLPLLIESNIGLVRSMLAKGLIADARPVLAYLRTVAPRDAIAAIEAEFAAKPIHSSKVAPDPIGLLADSSSSPDDRRRLADRLIADFRPGELGSAATPARENVVRDLRAVLQAIEALCLGSHDRALDLARPIARESAFAHWRLFVRSVAAFQRGEAGKAEEIFAKLPADSAPGRAAAAWLLALGSPAAAAQPPSHAVLDAACVLCREPGWGRILSKSDPLWRAGKHIASYRAVRDAEISFPSVGTDLSSALSDFYFNSIFSLSHDDRSVYADYLEDIEARGRRGSPTELMLARRTLCLLATTVPNSATGPDELQFMWEGFLREHQRSHGANPRLEAVAWCWLGEVLLRAKPRVPFGRRDQEGTTAHMALAALEKSIALDPANAGAHLVLASAYAATQRVRDHNRLLDTMARRFPEDRDVLLAAGKGAVERKSLVKAVDYFERALALDRLDPAIPDLLASARLRLAVQLYAKGRLVEGRRMLDRAGEIAVDSAENFVRGSWSIAARRGVMETMYGDPMLGAAALNEGRAACASSAVFLFFVRSAWSFYDDRRPLPAALQAELARSATGQPNAGDAAALVQLWRYWGTDGAAGRRRTHEEAWLRRYLKGAARRAFSRADAVILLELLRAVGHFDAEAMAFTAHVLKRDRADPLFRLYREIFNVLAPPHPAKLRAILSEARRRGDATAEKLAQLAIAEIGMLASNSEEEWEGDYDLSDRPGDEFSDPFGDGSDGIADLASASDKVLDEEEAAFMEMIARAPESEIRRLKKLRPKGMPAMLFDLMVAFARTGTAGRTLPAARVPGIPKAKKPKPERQDQPPRAVTPDRRSAERDTQQPDLFQP